MKGTAVLAALAAIAVAWPVWAAEPKGIFELDGTVHEFEEVAAFLVRDRGDATRFKTMVLLTRAVPDRQAIVEARDPETAAVNDPATEGGVVMLSVDPDGTIGMNAMIDGVQYIDTTGMLFGEPGSLSGECSTNTEERIACSIATPEPIETSGGKIWSFRAELDSEVLKREAGRPVEDGGGPPGEALMALEAALEGDDLDAILGLLSEDEAASYTADWRSPEENLAAAKDDLSRFLPKKMEVIGGEYVEDEVAELQVRGVFPGTADGVLYTVTMVREVDEWVYDGSMFSGIVE